MPIFQLTIDDAIGPVTDGYVEQEIETATRQQATWIVFSLPMDFIDHLISKAKLQH